MDVFWVDLLDVYELYIILVKGGFWGDIECEIKSITPYDNLFGLC